MQQADHRCSAIEILGIPRRPRRQLLGVVIAIGIAIGSLAAGRLSGHKVELGLVPIGAVGIGIGALVLASVDQQLRRRR